jgi:hypothetical protein
MTGFLSVGILISMLVAPMLGQGSYLKPPSTLKLEGVPEIPTSLGDLVQRYRASSPHSTVGWDPNGWSRCLSDDTITANGIL